MNKAHKAPDRPAKASPVIEVLYIKQKRFGTSRERITYMECDVSIAGKVTLRGLLYFIDGRLLMPQEAWQNTPHFEVTDQTLLFQIRDACAIAAIEVCE